MYGLVYGMVAQGWPKMHKPHNRLHPTRYSHVGDPTRAHSRSSAYLGPKNPKSSAQAPTRERASALYRSVPSSVVRPELARE